MEKINSIDFDTAKGLRTVEFLHGDMLQYKEEVDLLIVSVYGRSYEPVAGTLIGGLKDIGIPIELITKDIEIDLRDSLSTMLTTEISERFFKRILFFEIKSQLKSEGINLTLSEIFENLFISLLVLEKKNYKIKKIALPFIGTGKQKIPVHEVAELLPGITEKFLTELRYLEKVIFVDNNESKIKLLSEKLNERLGRPNIMVAKGIFAENLRISILKKISELQSLSEQHSQFLEEAKQAFSDAQVRGYQVAISGRKMLEVILNMVTKSTEGTLADKIVHLDAFRVAIWIKSYMHMIRIFGNEMAHTKVIINQIPFEMTQEDILLNLVCIERTLDFANKYIKEKGLEFNV